MSDMDRLPSHHSPEEVYVSEIDDPHASPLLVSIRDKMAWRSLNAAHPKAVFEVPYI